MYTDQSPAHFTLRDAARNARQRSLTSTPMNELRYKGISFVSGGTTGTSFEIVAPPPVSQTPVISKSQSQVGAEDRSDERALPKTNGSTITSQSARGAVPLPVSKPATDTKLQISRPISPTLSNSSDEVIFVGRNKTGRTRTSTSISRRQRSHEVGLDGDLEDAEQIQKESAIPSAVESHLKQQVPSTYTNQLPHRFRKGSSVQLNVPQSGSERAIDSLSVDHDTGSKPFTSEFLKHQNLVDKEKSALDRGNRAPGRRSRYARGRRKKNRRVVDENSDMSDEVLQDYIANMKENGTVDNTVIAGSMTTHMNDHGWGPIELDDFANLSTSDGITGAVSQVLSRRQRHSGVQYLVVWDDNPVDEARWIRAEVLQEDLEAQRLVTALETQLANIEWARANDVDSEDLDESEIEKVIVGSASDGIQERDDSQDLDQDIWEDEDDDEDEEEDDDGDAEAAMMADNDDLLQRYQERMSDEHIARLLQKQEELGLDADELLLFDEEGPEKEDDLFVPSKRRQHVRNAMEDLRNTFTVEEESSDAQASEPYGAFDVMDWSRPSLAATKTKVTKDVASFGLTDTDLERNLIESWTMDRTKKKAKKIEREELRAQGLLGGRSKKGEKRMWTSSQWRGGGVSMYELENALESFLHGSEMQLALPPMDKRARKMIHDIANRFGLKSKSTGTGDLRHPTLYKTKRTRRFDAFLFDTLEDRLSKRYGLGSTPRKAKNGDERNRANFNVRDGQLVGAGASELGVENKGRMLLEKMGWSKGTALGAIDNKGILMPIDHIVKKSRAGLG